MQRAVHILACFFICATSVAQQYPFVHYTPREGLANNRARLTYQDSRGRLYIATYGGLSIYDGTRFINYNTNNGLGANMINTIVEMGEDSFWIIPNANKINCLVNGRVSDHATADKFIPLINQLKKLSDGNYYAVADEGFYRLDNNRFVKIDLTGFENAHSANMVEIIEAGKKFYLLANPGYLSPYAGQLIIYDPALRKVVGYKTGVNAICLFKASENDVWISTTSGIMQIEQNGFPGKEITTRPLPGSFHIPPKVIGFCFYRDRQDNLWLSSWDGVYKISKNGHTTLFTTKNGLVTTVQTNIMQDYENNMWFTNELKGLSKLCNQQLEYFPAFKPGFDASDVFIQPSSDSVWIYDTHHDRVILMLPDGGSEEYTGPASMSMGKFVVTDRVYVLNKNGIFQWNGDPVSKRYSLSLLHPNGDDFLSATVDTKGNVVAITDKKIIVLSGNRMITERLPYFSDQVTTDKSGRIWFATRGNKLHCYELTGSGSRMKLTEVRVFSDELPKFGPRSIVADNGGNIWIGTRDNGVYCLYMNGLTIRYVRHFTTRSGLSDNFVNHLYCDKDNNIWACSPTGLDKISGIDNNVSIENITSRNNMYLAAFKIRQTRSGLYWILTTNGIFAYAPGQAQPKDWKPHLFCYGTAMGNKNELLIHSGQELPYSRNNLEFQLSAPSFVDEKQTRFSYRVDGSGNETWSEPSANATINLVNLPPGEYSLRAKAIFLHGRYPDVESSFSFVVLPPWWQTWWFRSLAALATVILALQAVRFYIQRKLQLQRAFMEKKQAVEKERTRIATDMHDDLGAGLSRIKFLSETIGMKKQQHLPIEEDINNIRTYSHEMIDKMGEIVWALNEKNDTLDDLLSYTRAYAVEYLAQNGISCHVEEPDNLPGRIVNGEFRRNIYLTVKEALHNIVKHAGATEVTINITITDRLSIQIRDNGKGIDEGPTLSVGNGLYNMSARIRGLKGRFEIKKTEGTQIDILVPLDG